VENGTEKHPVNFSCLSSVAANCSSNECVIIIQATLDYPG
jgi:hypothetical protein